MPPLRARGLHGSGLLCFEQKHQRAEILGAGRAGVFPTHPRPFLCSVTSDYPARRGRIPRGALRSLGKRCELRGQRNHSPTAQRGGGEPGLAVLPGRPRGQPPEVQHGVEIAATRERFQALLSYLGACF